ncbi:hypothetical protein DFH08DRAFT_1053717 [Mycena albidolilacea]|uniref:Uncharacterized protein n=1 Tax=Mycena albidolilacea TaxID=1033008 RepID=A0AAD7EYJ5_9AGAR|nr:hypothetical protein DFH08DRAFT_1053717 [Mycena albidolilacea]
MILSTIFLNPTARIFNLRFFLLSNIPVIVVIFKWPVRGLAAIDLSVVVIELGLLVMIYIITIFSPVYIPSLILLFFSLVFRIATVVKTKELLLTQRLAFLGGCTQINPPYTPQSILLNRSLARPLVRGESKYIIFARAFILSCIAPGVPAFGIFAVVIRPIKSAKGQSGSEFRIWGGGGSRPGP